MLGVALLSNEVASIFIQNLSKWLCLEFSFAIISAFIDIIFFMQIFKLKTEKKKLILMTLLLGILDFISAILFQMPYNKIIDFIIELLVVKLGFNQYNEKSILVDTLNVMTIITVENVVAKFFILIFPNISNYLDGLCDLSYMFLLKQTVIVIRIMIVMILYEKKVHIPLSNHLKTKRKNVYITSVFGIILISLTELQLLYIKEKILVLSLLNVVFYAFIIIQNIIRINMLEAQELKIHSLETYNKTLSNMYDSIRGFKHDFSNFVLALDGYAATDNLEGFREMSRAILKDCSNVNQMGILDPQVIENSAIYSIVTNKYFLAKEWHLNVNIEVLDKIGENNENNYEISRILGILLDNAIEAAKDTADKIINVRFVKDNKVKRHLVIVENSYDDKSIDINKIFEKGYTSKDCDSSEHGLGLWNIKNILMNNENLNLYTTADELFRQQLEIY